MRLDAAKETKWNGCDLKGIIGLYQAKIRAIAEKNNRVEEHCDGDWTRRGT